MALVLKVKSPYDYSNLTFRLKLSLKSAPKITTKTINFSILFCFVLFYLPDINCLLILVGPMITRKPASSIIVEEGQNLSLLCEATGQPTPMIKWRKAFSHVSKERTTVADGNLTIFNVTKTDGGTYECSAKNLLGQNSAVAQVLVTYRLKFTLIPPLKVIAFEYSIFKLNCAVLGNKEITWKKSGQHFPVPSYQNGTLLVKNVSPRDAGSYTCVARNLQRSIETTSVVEVRKPLSCSSIKTGYSGSPSGNYIIDPDGKGGVTPFSVYCDMRDKGGVGVTVISHDSESKTHVNHISPGCGSAGCYRKDVTYTGASTAQLATLTRVSQNCEQFIKYECTAGTAFLQQGYGWWVSRDGTRMDY